ncbi:hypothetical protein FG167_05945 [Lacinutrix sp. WUR7]|uniref:hypothetical protein n=1 Tax=Lacinutrix sp. WUR7 TaxID=2653681 RepID=UPI00193D051A|nr:hypothetical protein [Lacinutrix sp. WUR7]QRM88793.1 hypothetical protein FG167_05945 [Lacinutrix sp. WUR7]
METFNTEFDISPIQIIVEPSSDALLDGSGKVRLSIYHEDAPRKWRKVDVIDQGSNIFNASTDKSRLIKRPILKIRTNFIVDDLALKEQIAKTTTITYKLDDENFESSFDINEDEYDLGRTTDETFSITKRIQVLFN